jgi:hypothetical protein
MKEASPYTSVWLQQQWKTKGALRRFASVLGKTTFLIHAVALAKQAQVWSGAKFEPALDW